MKGYSPILITVISIINVIMAQEIELMQDYKKYYRIVDCWDCFQAQGRMCHKKDYDFSDMRYVMNVLRTSNLGKAVCCKPDSTEGYCAPNEQHSCSMKSLDNDEDSEYIDVLSADNRNYQMFAFCPTLSRQICGLPTSFI